MNFLLRCAPGNRKFVHCYGTNLDGYRGSCQTFDKDVDFMRKELTAAVSS